MPRAGMPKERKCELPVADELHPREPRLEARADRVRPRTGVVGDEVEIATVPFPADVGEVVELLFCWRRLDVIRFQYALDELSRFGHHFRLEWLRNGWFRLFCRTIHPDFSWLWHWGLGGGEKAMNVLAILMVFGEVFGRSLVQIISRLAD